MNMNTPNISQFQIKPEKTRTLWDQRRSMPSLFALSAAALALALAYLPNLRALIALWGEDPNYTHGYLVIPIALFIVWHQLSAPAPRTSAASVLAPWWGWGFLAAGLVLRAVMYEQGAEWSENITIILAFTALTWLFGSWFLLRRIWPAIAFLVFMLPLPATINELLALPLQSLAASSSRFLLQLTGIWVIQEGNVLGLSTPHGMEQLDVAYACSGLRMLTCMAATVVAILILEPLPRWKQVVLFLSIVPVALVSNMARIVATGWCFYLFQGPTIKHWVHDAAGWLMMVLGLALVGLELKLLSWLVPRESEDDKLVIPALNITKKELGKPKKKQDLEEL
jgi:exosortase